MSKLTASYLAGFIDGEGSIGVYKHSDGRDCGRVTISISNTSINTLDMIAGITHLGKIVRRGKRDINRKPCWNYAITNITDAYIFLRAIHPYIFTKSKQSALALEYCDKKLHDNNAPNIDYYDGETRRLNKIGDNYVR